MRFATCWQYIRLQRVIRRRKKQSKKIISYIRKHPEEVNSLRDSSDDASQAAYKRLQDLKLVRYAQGFRNAWIKHDLFNKLNGLTGPENKKKFVAALQKGIVGKYGESGIKVLSSAEGIYTHELKIGGSGARILGRVVDGVLIFDKYLPKGLH